MLWKIVVAVPAPGRPPDPEQLLVIDRNVIEDLLHVAGLGQRSVPDSTSSPFGSLVQPLQPPAKRLSPIPRFGCWFSDQTLSVFTMTTAESHHQPGQDHVNGVASFDLVHHHRADDRIFLYAFDLIELNGNDLAGGSAR
jgi:hypothetical protein